MQFIFHEKVGAEIKSSREKGWNECEFYDARICKLVQIYSKLCLKSKLYIPFLSIIVEVLTIAHGTQIPEI